MEQLAVHDLFHDAAHGEIVAAQQSARTEDHHQDEHQRVDDHAVAVEAAGGLGQDGQDGSGEDGAQHGAHAAQNHHDQDLDGLHEAEGGGVQNADYGWHPFSRPLNQILEDMIEKEVKKRVEKELRIRALKNAQDEIGKQ